MAADFISMSSLTTSGLRRSVAAATRKSRRLKTETCEKHDQLDWKATNNLALKASCKLKMPSGDSAVGTLFEMESDGRLLYLFISTNRRLSIQSPDELLNAKLHLSDPEPDKNKCNYISLASGKVLKVWHTSPRNEHKGNTIVELSDKAAEECRNRDAHFLKIGTALPDEEVVVWFWWPLATQTPVLSFKPRALIESVNDNELTLVLSDIPESMREKWGERGSQLLHQLYGGSSVILINKRGEAVAMDTLLKVGWRDDNDIKFASSCDIDTNQHIYPFKSTVLPLSKLLVHMNCEKCHPLVENDPPTLTKHPKELQTVFNIDLRSAICKESAEIADNCVKCKNNLCVSHLSQVSTCSFCKSTSLDTQSNGFVQRRITKSEVQCLQGEVPVSRRDLSVHMICSKQNVAYLQKVRSFASMAKRSKMFCNLYKYSPNSHTILMNSLQYFKILFKVGIQ